MSFLRLRTLWCAVLLASAGCSADTSTSASAAAAPGANIAAVFQQQMVKCLQIPIGTHFAKGTRIEVDVKLKPDGYLSEPPSILSATPLNDAGTDVAVTSMIAAITGCQGYNLPADSYAAWKEIRLTFDITRFVAP